MNSALEKTEPARRQELVNALAVNITVIGYNRRNMSLITHFLVVGLGLSPFMVNYYFSQSPNIV